MPSRMVINTKSTVGYNNKLKRATPNMKLGVNSDVNSDGTVSVGIKHNLGVSKVKLPHVVQKDASHVIRKAAEKVESLAPEKDPSAPKSTTTKHEIDLILLMIAATATARLLFR